MSQALQVVVRTGNESKNQIHDVVQGNQTTIRAVQGARYQLKNPGHKDTGPDQIRSKRIGKNLHISLDDRNDTQLVIEGYYDGRAGDTSSLYGMANDGRMYEYIPEDPVPEGLVANFSDGGAPVSQALGGTSVDGVFELSALPLVAATGGIGAGWMAAGGVAVAAAAGGGSSSGGATPSVPTSMEIIYAAAQNNNAVSVGALTQAVYEDAGISGVNSSNLPLINEMLDTLNINGAAVSTAMKVQALVNAVLKVQALANNTASIAPVQLLTTADIQSLGLSTVLETAADISLYNSILDKAQGTSVDTAAEVINLASISKRIQRTAQNEITSSALTAKDLADSGLTGVTNINLADVVEAIKNQANDGSGVDTLPELQALIDGVLSAGDALAVLTEFAEKNAQGLANVATGAPQIRNYSQAGVTGVDDNNLNSINDALASAAVNGAATNTVLELQAVIDAYNIIKANADGMASNNTTNPAREQYAAIGVTGVSSFATESLLGDVVDGKSFSAVDTVVEVQALADAANTVMAGAAGGTVPTLAQLQLLGLSGVNVNNLASIQEAIAATADNGLGVDTFAKLQSVVTAAGNAALDALRTISTAAQNNTAGTASTLNVVEIEGITSTGQLTLDDVLTTELAVAQDVCTYAECYANLDLSTHLWIDQSMLSAYCVS